MIYWLHPDFEALWRLNLRKEMWSNLPLLLLLLLNSAIRLPCMPKMTLIWPFNSDTDIGKSPLGFSSRTVPLVPLAPAWGLALHSSTLTNLQNGPDPLATVPAVDVDWLSTWPCTMTSSRLISFSYCRARKKNKTGLLLLFYIYHKQLGYISMSLLIYNKASLSQMFTWNFLAQFKMNFHCPAELMSFLLRT